jgi:hypothetical protein
MHSFRNLILTLFLFSFNAKGQRIQYNALLDTAIKFTGQIFVSSKPILKIRIDEKDIRDNYDDLKEVYKDVDTSTLFQIIENSKNIDTTSWTDDELSKFILIQNREQGVEFKYVVHKLNLTNKKELRYYREEINYFNSADPADKNIYYYSRPVFDNSKQFAIVQWDNRHSGFGGGGEIKLYKLTSDTWRELGIVRKWRY